MNNRQRKKWQKKHGLYIAPNELWNLDYTIAEFILPRLKKFKKESMGYPDQGEMDTPEKWNAALDKMILAFEYILNDNWWIGNPEYDYSDGLHIGFEKDDKTGWHKVVISEDDWVKDVSQRRDNEDQRRKQVINEGLQLFTKWFRHLWW